MNRYKINWFIAFWVIALISVIFLYFRYRVSNKFIGIVETKSHLIGVQEPGTIQDVLVPIGEKVKRGQVLVTLDFSDLQTAIGQLKDELSNIQKLDEARQNRYSLEFQREYLRLENEVSDLTERLAMIEAKRTELTGLNTEIERLKNAEEAGLGHSRDMADLIVQRDAIASYLREQGEEFKYQNQTLDKTRQTRQSLRAADANGMIKSMLLEPVERVEDLRREISVIEHRMVMRTIFAPCDGYVVEMFAHQGDIVEEFIPILTVEESRTRYLTVYIPEKTKIGLEVGMRVRIYSQRLKRHVKPGVITFINPGYSQITERLTFQGQFFWARSVRVELDDHHELLPGEQIIARIDPNKDHDDLFSQSAQAAEASTDRDDQKSRLFTVEKMQIPKTLNEVSRIEPSGIAWLEDIGKYVIVSDDTGIKDAENDHAPWVFLMDEKGRVESTPIVLKGVDRFNDLEAIAPTDNGILYLISSQNISKGGKRPGSREMILQVHYDGEELVVRDKVSFLTLLLRSYSKEQLSELGLREFEEDGKPVLNIEGAAWRNHMLYLGLKVPVGEKGAIIWRLRDPHTIFQNEKLNTGQLSVFGTIDLGEHRGRTAGISDLTFDSRGVLWALSTIAGAEDEDQLGGFHRIDRFADDHLEAVRIMDFPGLKSEGLCSRELNHFFIVFDEDNDKPSFCTVTTEDL